MDDRAKLFSCFRHDGVCLEAIKTDGSRCACALYQFKNNNER